MRLILKTQNPDGIPSNWEINEFESKKGVSVNEVTRLYSAFKVGKRRKIKRLRLKVTTHPCETCGFHKYASGTIGTKEFDREIY